MWDRSETVYISNIQHPSQFIASIRADTSSAHSFTLLKNFFTYVDDLEYYVFNKKTLSSKEFKEAIEVGLDELTLSTVMDQFFSIHINLEFIEPEC